VNCAFVISYISAILACHCLTRCLKGNYIASESIRHIVDMLKVNTTLKLIHIDGEVSIGFCLL